MILSTGEVRWRVRERFERRGDGEEVRRDGEDKRRSQPIERMKRGGGTMEREREEEDEAEVAAMLSSKKERERERETVCRRREGERRWVVGFRWKDEEDRCICSMLHTHALGMLLLRSHPGQIYF